MTPRERFVNALIFGSVDEVPNMEICTWAQTRQRWVEEGMPEEVNTRFMEHGSEYFGLTGYASTHFDAINPRPLKAKEIIEETEEYEVFIDSLGRTRRALKEGTVDGTRMSMDTYIDFAVKDMATFEGYRHGYDTCHDAERYPHNWEFVKMGAKHSTLPVTVLNPLGGCFGFYSMLRNWIGTENLCYLFYDDPKLIEACLETLSDFAVRIFEKGVREVPCDFYYIHEDMAGKGGPLMGPDMFRKFILPHYKRFVGFLKSNGVRIVLVDTDGDHSVLIPVMLEAGVDGFGPIERAAGMDPVAVRKTYGKAVCMVGGVDKREVAKGPQATDAEVTRLAPVLESGGFIPTIDHAVHPDISLEDFQYYLEQKRKLLEGRL